MAADVSMKAELEIVPKGKPGYKTTEFWKSIVVHLVAVAVIAYGLHKGSDGIVQFGTILMAVTQGTYNLGRSYEKGSLSKIIGEFLSKGEPK